MTHAADARLADHMVLGTWGISGAYSVTGRPAGCGPVAESQFSAVLDAAWDAGLRWIDTAPSYGGGAGIERLARWQRVSGRTWRTVVKPGRPLAPAGPFSDLRDQAIGSEIGACAQRLGTPSAVLIKDPPENSYRDGSLNGLLRRLARQWPVVGVATHRLDLVPLLGDAPAGNAVMQLEFHLLNRFSAVRAADSARKSGWQVWAMQPLAYGFLGGRYSAETRFPDDDWRSRMPGQARTALAAGADALRRSLPFSVRDYPPSQLALAWCLASPVVDRVVIGPRAPRQFADAMAAARLATEPAVTEFVKDLHETPLAQGTPPGPAAHIRPA